MRDQQQTHRRPHQLPEEDEVTSGVAGYKSAHTTKVPRSHPTHRNEGIPENSYYAAIGLRWLC